MSGIHDMTRRVLVRQDYAEESIYRRALPREPLFVFVIDGPIDAPDWMPAGSFTSTKQGPRATTIQRPS